MVAYIRFIGETLGACPRVSFDFCRIIMILGRGTVSNISLDTSRECLENPKKFAMLMHFSRFPLVRSMLIVLLELLVCESLFWTLISVLEAGSNVVNLR